MPKTTHTHPSLESLFLSQYLQDAWDDYLRSLTRETFPCWDYIVLTASDEHQAEGFRKQLKQRQVSGFLPGRTHFHVIPDPEGRRVGSGGATLNVLRSLVEETKTEDFGNLRILVIHSGGDSRRVPQYSALGKLFSPVPRVLPNGRPSTLFDEFLVAMSGVAGRIREGMLLLSGDVLLLFNPLQIDFSGEGAAVFLDHAAHYLARYLLSAHYGFDRRIAVVRRRAGVCGGRFGRAHDRLFHLVARDQSGALRTCFGGFHSARVRHHAHHARAIQVLE